MWLKMLSLYTIMFFVSVIANANAKTMITSFHGYALGQSCDGKETIETEYGKLTIKCTDHTKKVRLLHLNIKDAYSYNLLKEVIIDRMGSGKVNDVYGLIWNTKSRSNCKWNDEVFGSSVMAYLTDPKDSYSSYSAFAIWGNKISCEDDRIADNLANKKKSKDKKKLFDLLK